VNSGDDATPTTTTRCRRPLIVTLQRKPRPQLVARHEDPSLISTSCSRPGSGIRPACRMHPVEPSLPARQSHHLPGDRLPVARQRNARRRHYPRLYRFHPGVAASRAATLRGACFSPANTSGKRNSRYIRLCVRSSDRSVETDIT
jgi:hypothetical protein